MNPSGSTKLDVILTAIDGDQVVLETVKDKNIITWPLDNLPRPLKIGSPLTIELQKGDHPFSQPAKNNHETNSRNEHEETMRKLLEDLVN